MADIPPPATVYFADAAVEALEPGKTLPRKFERMLGLLGLPARVEGKSVGVKMHYGGDVGYSTIPPVFVRILVQALRQAGARRVYTMDNDPVDGVARGYTREVLGCEVASTFGASGSDARAFPIGFKELDEALFGGEALDCDVLVVLSHAKGHGACGFGGAIKNIAMGVTPRETRRKLHRLEGGIAYNPDACVYCKRCVEECRNKAIIPDDGARRVRFFFHNCTYCQHCVLVCPPRALSMQNRSFEDFARGMALVASKFLDARGSGSVLYVNVALAVTVFCDCWGMTTPALVPDIGVFASEDICAVDRAFLEKVAVEDLLPKGLPKGRVLGEKGHLFERIHGKDPWLMVEMLREMRGLPASHTLVEVL